MNEEQRVRYSSLLANLITLTKHRISVMPRCRSRHPNACDTGICSYSHIQIYYATMSLYDMKKPELAVFWSC